MPAPTPDEYRLHLPGPPPDDFSRALQNWADYLPFPRLIDWTPTVYQGAAPLDLSAIDQAVFYQNGPYALFWMDVTLDDSGTAGQSITIGLPLAYEDASTAFGSYGSGWATIGGTNYNFVMNRSGTSGTRLVLRGTGGALGSTVGVTLAAGDVIHLSGSYPLALAAYR